MRVFDIPVEFAPTEAWAKAVFWAGNGTSVIKLTATAKRLNRSRRASLRKEQPWVRFCVSEGAYETDNVCSARIEQNAVAAG